MNKQNWKTKIKTEKTVVPVSANISKLNDDERNKKAI